MNGTAEQHGTSAGAAACHAEARRPAPLRLTTRGRAAVVLVALGLAAGGVLSAQSAAAGGPQGAVPVVAHVVQ
ncbi:MAG: hypothetical protein H5T83_00740, partial [Actinotalea sp.]|nr:hypothetical protein [Actinotalea sp.]